MKKSVQKPVPSTRKTPTNLKPNKSFQKITESPRSVPVSNYSSSKSKPKPNSPIQNEYFEGSARPSEIECHLNSPTINRRMISDELADSLQTSGRNYLMDSDIQDTETFSPSLNILKKEISLLKRNLTDTQTRNISLTKELSKLQHENSINLMKVKKTENKCQELIEKHSQDQNTINELSYLNSQLSKYQSEVIFKKSEINRIKSDAKEGTHHTKKEIDLLKNKVREVEEHFEKKSKNMIKYIEKIKISFYSVQRLIESSDGDLYLRIQKSLDKIEIICNDMLANITFGESPFESEDVFEYKKMIEEMTLNYEEQLNELKKELLISRKETGKEESKLKDLNNQYKEAINRLKKNQALMKEKFTITAQQDKETITTLQSALEIQKAVSANLKEENNSLKSYNGVLTKRAKENERSIEIRNSVNDLVNSYRQRDSAKQDEKKSIIGYSTFSSPRLENPASSSSRQPELEGTKDKLFQSIKAKHSSTASKLHRQLSEEVIVQNRGSQSSSKNKSLSNYINLPIPMQSAFESKGHMSEHPELLPPKYQLPDTVRKAEDSLLNYINKDTSTSRSETYKYEKEPITELKQEIALLDEEIGEIQRNINLELGAIQHQ